MLIRCQETRAVLDAYKRTRLRSGAGLPADPQAMTAPVFPAPSRGSDATVTAADTSTASPTLLRNASNAHSLDVVETRLLERSLELTRLSVELSESQQRCDRLERQLETVMAQSNDALLILTEDGSIETCNEAAGRLFGHDSMHGRHVASLFSQADGKQIRQLFNQLANGGTPIGMASEARARHADGRNFPAEILACRVSEQGQSVVTVRDLSARRVLEREVLEVADHEKRSLGQELHDSVGQQLTGLRFYAEMLTQSLAAKSLPEAEQADKLRAILEVVGNQVRELSHGLMPTEVTGTSLPRALANLASEIDYLQQFQCEFVCYEPAISSTLSDMVATQLYRIVQEATQNAIRHSQGDRIRISLETDDHEIFLQIVDNGAGIAENFTRQPRGGIRIMQHRAALIGATLRIEAGEGGGTLVQCRLRSESQGSA
jgi:two-component system, LuxR family, sensor kinase FixL